MSGRDLLQAITWTSAKLLPFVDPQEQNSVKLEFSENAFPNAVCKI